MKKVMITDFDCKIFLSINKYKIWANKLENGEHIAYNFNSINYAKEYAGIIGIHNNDKVFLKQNDKILIKEIVDKTWQTKIIPLFK